MVRNVLELRTLDLGPWGMLCKDSTSDRARCAECQAYYYSVWLFHMDQLPVGWIRQLSPRCWEVRTVKTLRILRTLRRGEGFAKTETVERRLKIEAVVLINYYSIVFLVSTTIFLALLS